MKRFEFSDKERSGIEISSSDIELGVPECWLSLLGKIVGEKKASIGGLRNTMGLVWRTAKPFSIRALEPNLFQFLFQSEEDKAKVLKGKAWTFDGQYLLLKEWKKDDTQFHERDMKVELRVQIHNLPLHWLSAETGIKVGKLFSNILDVIPPGPGVSNNKIVKILVEENISKPIPRGTMIKLGQEEHWIDLRYENLLHFCFYCGRIGHSDRVCDTMKSDIQRNVFKNGQYGDWLRAPGGGFGIYRETRSPSSQGVQSNSESPQATIRGGGEPSLGKASNLGTESVGEGLVEVVVESIIPPKPIQKEVCGSGVVSERVETQPLSLETNPVMPMDLDSSKGDKLDINNLIDVIVQSEQHDNIGVKTPKSFVRVTRSKKSRAKVKSVEGVKSDNVSGIFTVKSAYKAIRKQKMVVKGSEENSKGQSLQEAVWKVTWRLPISQRAKQVWKLAGLFWEKLQYEPADFRVWWDEGENADRTVGGPKVLCMEGADSRNASTYSVELELLQLRDWLLKCEGRERQKVHIQVNNKQLRRWLKGRVIFDASISALLEDIFQLLSDFSESVFVDDL
ncbi:Unknown protein [Striga hermonthica]|uniref:CCHC-type domain-containing protein n=1 Tax=Striga hermonthica TaxID=68872 RepID=A0A9N7NEG4_STRHE|nr:Unknown protein [Striga hermonthica]